MRMTWKTVQHPVLSRFMRRTVSAAKCFSKISQNSSATAFKANECIRSVKIYIFPLKLHFCVLLSFFFKVCLVFSIRQKSGGISWMPSFCSFFFNWMLSLFSQSSPRVICTEALRPLWLVKFINTWPISTFLSFRSSTYSSFPRETKNL